MIRYHLFLEGKGEAPEEALISAICQAFNCTPTQALAELREGPYGLVWRVLDWRNYADAYHRLQRGDEDVDDWLFLVREIQAEMAREHARRVRQRPHHGQRG